MKRRGGGEQCREGGSRERKGRMVRIWRMGEGMERRG